MFLGRERDGFGVMLGAYTYSGYFNLMGLLIVV